MLDRAMLLDPVEQVRERIGFLVAQLAQAERIRSPASASAAAEMQAEHHRLSLLWAEVQKLREGLAAAEELALCAVNAGEDPQALVSEGQAVERELRQRLAWLMLSLLPRRGEVSLGVHEADGGRALELWLRPFFDDLPRRGWQARGRWFADQRWGPALSPEDLLTQRPHKQPRFRSMLLHVRGEWAGGLLALERGLHRYVGLSPVPGVAECHLFVQPIASRFSLTDGELEKEELKPGAPLSDHELRLLGAVRHWEEGKPLRLVGGARSLEMPPGDYWARFEEVAFEHMLHLEAQGGMEGGETFRFHLDGGRGKGRAGR